MELERGKRGDREIGRVHFSVSGMIRALVREIGMPLIDLRKRERKFHSKAFGVISAICTGKVLLLTLGN